MTLEYGIEINNSAIVSNLKKISNQIYKLLPYREEEKDWKKLLFTILEEIGGMSKLLFDQQEALFKLCCKLKGLEDLVDIFEYRRTIFDCMTLIDKIKCQLETI